MNANQVRYADWQETVSRIALNTFDVSTMDDHAILTGQEYLRQIPVRDAILADFAARPERMEPSRVLLLALTRTGDTNPARTVLAAVNYLEGDYESAYSLVSDVLDTEEYSLARLLWNGLDMKAPASILRNSFSHFNPEDLLAE